MNPHVFIFLWLLQLELLLNNGVFARPSTLKQSPPSLNAIPELARIDSPSFRYSPDQLERNYGPRAIILPPEASQTDPALLDASTRRTSITAFSVFPIIFYTFVALCLSYIVVRLLKRFNILFVPAFLTSSQNSISTKASHQWKLNSLRKYWKGRKGLSSSVHSVELLPTSNPPSSTSTVDFQPSSPMSVYSNGITGRSSMQKDQAISRSSSFGALPSNTPSIYGPVPLLPTPLTPPLTTISSSFSLSPRTPSPILRNHKPPPPANLKDKYFPSRLPLIAAFTHHMTPFSNSHAEDEVRSHRRSQPLGGVPLRSSVSSPFGEGRARSPLSLEMLALSHSEDISSRDDPLLIDLSEEKPLSLSREISQGTVDSDLGMHRVYSGSPFGDERVQATLVPKPVPLVDLETEEEDSQKHLWGFSKSASPKSQEIALIHFENDGAVLPKSTLPPIPNETYTARIMDPLGVKTLVDVESLGRSELEMNSSPFALQWGDKKEKVPSGEQPQENSIANDGVNETWNWDDPESDKAWAFDHNSEKGDLIEFEEESIPYTDQGNDGNKNTAVVEIPKDTAALSYVEPIAAVPTLENTPTLLFDTPDVVVSQILPHPFVETTLTKAENVSVPGVEESLTVAAIDPVYERLEEQEAGPLEGIVNFAIESRVSEEENEENELPRATCASSGYEDDEGTGMKNALIEPPDFTVYSGDGLLEATQTFMGSSDSQVDLQDSSIASNSLHAGLTGTFTGATYDYAPPVVVVVVEEQLIAGDVVDIDASTSHDWQVGSPAMRQDQQPQSTIAVDGDFNKLELDVPSSYEQISNTLTRQNPQSRSIMTANEDIDEATIIMNSDEANENQADSPITPRVHLSRFEKFDFAAPVGQKYEYPEESLDPKPLLLAVEVTGKAESFFNEGPSQTPTPPSSPPLSSQKKVSREEGMPTLSLRALKTPASCGISATATNPKGLEQASRETPASIPGSFPETSISLSASATSSDANTALDSGDADKAPTTAALVPSHVRTRTTRSAIDIALAMQLRPRLGAGADPTWMVHFLMSMFGWFVIHIYGHGEY